MKHKSPKHMEQGQEQVENRTGNSGGVQTKETNQHSENTGDSSSTAETRLSEEGQQKVIQTRNPLETKHQLEEEH